MVESLDLIGAEQSLFAFGTQLFDLTHFMFESGWWGMLQGLPGYSVDSVTRALDRVRPGLTHCDLHALMAAIG